MVYIHAWLLIPLLHYSRTSIQKTGTENGENDEESFELTDSRSLRRVIFRSNLSEQKLFNFQHPHVEEVWFLTTRHDTTRHVHAQACCPSPLSFYQVVCRLCVCSTTQSTQSHNRIQQSRFVLSAFRCQHGTSRKDPLPTHYYALLLYLVKSFYACTQIDYCDQVLGCCQEKRQEKN